MTTAQAVGAVSREAAEWYAMDWQAINRNVRRLQVRIVQATKASRWGKLRALQHLLTHSYSGKVLAVRRVTENNGKETPGVDQEIWDTPEKKTQAIHALEQRGYQPQPLRRVYIPKSDGKTMRPLGIPTMKDRARQALHLLALDPGLGLQPESESLVPIHSVYRSWLDAVGTPIAVQQKLMRHSDIRTTMNIYGDVVTDEMAHAHSKVVGLALNRQVIAN
jgi:reverse transcriptase-like protein